MRTALKIVFVLVCIALCGCKPSQMPRATSEFEMKPEYLDIPTL